MAYLFNSLSDDSGEEGKQNIFGGTQSDQGTTSGTAAAAGGGAIDKGGGAGGGGGSSGAGGGGTAAPSKAQTSAQQSAYNPQAASQAYSSAAKSIKLPTQALGQAEGALQKGSQELQEKANAYGQKASQTAQGYNVDEATLQAAAKGDQAAYQKTAKALQAPSGAETYEAFEGLGNLPAIQNIRDPGSLYRQEAGPNYTAGQSRFDAAMLRRNPEFVRQQQELLAKGSALEKESQAKAKEETEKARNLLKSQYEKSTGQIKGTLGKLGEDIVSKAKEKEAAEDARRAGLDPKEIAKAEQEKIKAQIKEDLKYAPPGSEQARALKYLSDEYDLSPYVNINKDTDWRQFIGEPEAEQYNRVQGLLGGAGMLTPTQGGPGAEYDKGEFSRNAYQKILSEIQGKRQMQDRANQQEIDQIMKGLTGKAEEATKLRESPREAAARASLEEKLRSQGVENIDPEIMAELLPKNAASTQTPYSWQDLLSGEEAGRLNELYADTGLMQPSPYEAGRAGKEQYDVDALLNAYRQKAGKKQMAVTPENVQTGKPGGTQKTLQQKPNQGR